MGDSKDVVKRMDNYTLFREANKNVKKDKFIKTNELLNLRDKLPQAEQQQKTLILLLKNQTLRVNIVILRILMIY